MRQLTFLIAIRLISCDFNVFFFFFFCVVVGFSSPIVEPFANTRDYSVRMSESDDYANNDATTVKFTVTAVKPYPLSSASTTTTTTAGALTSQQASSVNATTTSSATTKTSMAATSNSKGTLVGGGGGGFVRTVGRSLVDELDKEIATKEQNVAELQKQIDKEHYLLSILRRERDSELDKLAQARARRGGAVVDDNDRHLQRPRIWCAQDSRVAPCRAARAAAQAASSVTGEASPVGARWL
jgi:hypothetical protein